MSHFDVFNGDADGMCALRQLRLAEPRDAVRITGLKREIALLERVPARAGDSVTVLDLSADVNHGALIALLVRGVRVTYFDHHGSGEVPNHPLLAAWIDRSPETCTGLIVDRYLGGRYSAWAVTAAFGDNMHGAAMRLARARHIEESDTCALRELGECLNYNAYGDTPADPVIQPMALYALLGRYTDPRDFIRAEPVFAQLRETRRQDLALAADVAPSSATAAARLFILPDAAWSRRVRGEFGNLLAGRQPQCAHAILVPDAQGGFTVSVRAPSSARYGADRLCAPFPTGGGRALAAGITHLPAEALAGFCDRFHAAWPERHSH